MNKQKKSYIKKYGESRGRLLYASQKNCLRAGRKGNAVDLAEARRLHEIIKAADPKLVIAAEKFSQCFGGRAE